MAWTTAHLGPNPETRGLPFALVMVSLSVLASACETFEKAQAREQAPALSQSVREAELIVVGRVLGPVDVTPEAGSRKHLEAHWILVERTLKGVDETGQRFRARPGGLRWLDGQSYVVCLKRLGLDALEAIPQELLEATDANIVAVAQEIARQGEAVHPKRSLWMRHEGGWGAGLLAEFYVTEDGRFEWKGRLGTGPTEKSEYQVWTGRLPGEILARLISEVERAGAGPSADDAGIAAFRWLDAAGKAQSRSYYLPDRSPSANLLARIEALAHEYGTSH